MKENPMPKVKKPRSMKELRAHWLVEEVSDERDGNDAGDGIWVYFIPGFWNPMLEVHCIHEDTVKEVLSAWGPERCNCEDCVDHQHKEALKINERNLQPGELG